ncbi:hypothetical protein [Nitratireductor pacificus]|uniref:Uncharacterized protein n=1 Tax=Nitratireductor pacificus pht-3B TaxID=391937 RepID=K2MZP5_9HYPH|nr:hypothetical protein [Nitratireductor pacificus]EKF17468.1 hypothetical protein NA2_18186 [Nitratireductor pacificus pht-3B]
MDIGTAVGLQATAIGVGMGAVLAGAHAAGMEAMREAREERATRAREAAIQDLGDVAREMATELAAAHAEIAKLKRLLAQRQAYIDSLRRTA